MYSLRRRVARVSENLFAALVGAFVVALAQGMTPMEIVDYAVLNAHKLPELVQSLVIQAFAGVA